MYLLLAWVSLLLVVFRLTRLIRTAIQPSRRGEPAGLARQTWLAPRLRA